MFYISAPTIPIIYPSMPVSHLPQTFTSLRLPLHPTSPKHIT